LGIGIGYQSMHGQYIGIGPKKDISVDLYFWVGLPRWELQQWLILCNGSALICWQVWGKH